LGGNSAAIVLADADLDLAAAGIAWAGTYHSGQDCVGIKRVFVVEQIADEFLQKLIAIVKDLRPGVDYGPYITPEAMYRVKARVDDAVKNGAKLLCGGELLKFSAGAGNWLTPSVILNTDSEIELVAEETFGNTIPVMVVPDVDVAVKEANNTTYGLSNSVFTRDIEFARALAYRLQSGMVFINEPFVAIPGWDHWTGWKNSGFGTVESKLMQCLKKKVLSINKLGQKRSFWYPYPEPQKS
jgi:betaine-aldehyde dehydrogenase